MHQESLEQAAIFADSLPKDRALKIADVGSQDINGCYRSLFTKPGWTYIGIDQCAGKNVDYVMEDPYTPWPEAEEFDVVISGQVLEHAEMPWKLVAAMARILKPEGLCWLAAPFSCHYHPHPKDCWRIYPDGMRALLEWAKLTELRCFMYSSDTYCWAIKS